MKVQNISFSRPLAAAHTPQVSEPSAVIVDSIEAPRPNYQRAAHSWPCNPGRQTLSTVAPTPQSRVAQYNAEFWHTVGNPARLICALGSGKPFESEVAHRLEEIFGLPVTREGLLRVFALVWPDAHWVLSNPRVEAGGIVGIDLAAFDNLGTVAAEVRYLLQKHSDGSVELHAYAASLPLRFRQMGFSAQMQALEQKLLALTPAHQKNRVTLNAGYADNPNTGDPLPGIGFYLHAVRGFQFADAYDAVSQLRFYRASLNRSGPGETLDRDRLVTRFKEWVADAPLVYNGRPACNQARQRLKGLADAVVTPLDLASLDLAGVSCPTRDRSCPAGKAFLLSESTLIWRGVRFTDASTPAFAQSVANFERQVAHEVARDTPARTAWLVDLEDKARNGTDEERLTAITAIARDGGTWWKAFLQERKSSERNAQGRGAIQEALDVLDGSRIASALRAASQAPELSDFVRTSMQQRLRAWLEDNSLRALP